MKLAQFRNSLWAYDVWTPVAFSAALSVITMVTYVLAFRTPRVEFDPRG
jgi:hypothetical protein